MHARNIHSKECALRVCELLPWLASIAAASCSGGRSLPMPLLFLAFAAATAAAVGVAKAAACNGITSVTVTSSQSHETRVSDGTAGD